MPYPGYATRRPSIAGSSANWLVVWEENSFTSVYTIYGAIVSLSGSTVVVGSSFQFYLPAPGDKRNPNAASDGGVYLVSWEQAANEISAALVSTAGTFASVVFPIATGPGPDLRANPAAAGRSTDMGFVVTWQEDRYTTPMQQDVYGVPVSHSGQVGIVAAISTNPTKLENYPAIANNGSDSYLVAWADTRSGDYDVYGTRINVVPSGSSTTLSLLDNPALAISHDVQGVQYFPAVAPVSSTTTSYIVAHESGVVNDPGTVKIRASIVRP
jgi:hypothetical protein